MGLLGWQHKPSLQINHFATSPFRTTSGYVEQCFVFVNVIEQISQAEHWICWTDVLGLSLPVANGIKRISERDQRCLIWFNNHLHLHIYADLPNLTINQDFQCGRAMDKKLKCNLNLFDRTNRLLKLILSCKIPKRRPQQLMLVLSCEQLFFAKKTEYYGVRFCSIVVKPLLCNDVVIAVYRVRYPKHGMSTWLWKIWQKIVICGFFRYSFCSMLFRLYMFL